MDTRVSHEESNGEEVLAAEEEAAFARDVDAGYKGDFETWRAARRMTTTLPAPTEVEIPVFEDDDIPF